VEVKDTFWFEQLNPDEFEGVSHTKLPAWSHW
jgi:hypothetical protein